MGQVTVLQQLSSIMHERPHRRTSFMNLMPKPAICCRLLCVLLLSGLCPALPASPRGGYPLSPTLQQSNPPVTAPDSSQPNPSGDEKLSLSDQVIQDVLEPLHNGVSIQNVAQIMSVFDKQAMPDYSSLQGQFRAFFGLYSEVDFHYQILQVTADKDHGSATAEIEMDAIPYEVTQIQERRSAQMRFQLKLTAKGWKVVGFTPADFFSPTFNRPGAR
jgi:hypothetical protein